MSTAAAPIGSPRTPPGQSASAASEAGSGTLVIGPDYRGVVQIVDDAKRVVAEVSLGSRVSIELAAGRYSLVDTDGAVIMSVVVDGGAHADVELPERFKASDSAATPIGASAGSSGATPRSDAAVTTGRLGPAPLAAQQEVELIRKRPWKRWAAPLLSAVLPGAGQALNRQPGRGLAAFTGTVGLVLGTIAVVAARDSADGADPTETGGDAREVVRLAGLAGLSSAAGLLYIGQILDAHAQASDRSGTNPFTRHRIAFELSRFTTVAFAPNRPSYALYSDWSVAVLGQVAPRVSVGLSDASIKYTSDRKMLTVQAGARGAYRFFERRRVWLSAGGGVLLQGTRADASPGPLGATEPATEADTERAFSAVPYVHFDARLFLLDRWSLGLTPRVGVPLLARRFGRGLALPRYATTFELGATTGVYF